MSSQVSCKFPYLYSYNCTLTLADVTGSYYSTFSTIYLVLSSTMLCVYIYLLYDATQRKGAPLNPFKSTTKKIMIMYLFCIVLLCQLICGSDLFAWSGRLPVLLNELSYTTAIYSCVLVL